MIKFVIPTLVLVICLVTLWQLVVTPRLAARKNAKKANATWQQAHEKAKAEATNQPPTYPEADATDLNPKNWGTPT